MTKIVRWSDSTGDNDPVLRVVMRYAQEIEPSAQEVAKIAQAVARAESCPRPKRAARPWPWALSSRSLRWGSAVAAMAVGAVSLAATLDWPKASSGVTRLTREPTNPVVALRVAPPSEPKATAPLPAASSAPLRSERLVAAPAVEELSEVSLLTQARQKLRVEPAKTLALLQTHVRRFPNSAFAEEREALRVEANLASGNRAAAESGYHAFVAKYPNSIYLPRLAATRTHD